ncbi:MAG: SAM-dependent methyltransferase [Bradyrhizobiaceae bacterium]|nr:SAM-dependent methyltransferase [Bradyrhizobiaceae bacterium]
MPIIMTPIGYVRGGRKEATKDHWGNNRSRIELDAGQFGPDAVAGLDALSHIEVIFYFHLHADEPVERGARHPRDRADWPAVGIFAQRGRMRPNRIGLSVCRIVAMHGTGIEVEGLDAVDGTPVLDIKPYWSANAPRGPVREPQWARELMSNYW